MFTPFHTFLNALPSQQDNSQEDAFEIRIRWPLQQVQWRLLQHKENITKQQQAKQIDLYGQG